jgi:hypothetical protein
MCAGDASPWPRVADLRAALGTDPAVKRVLAELRPAAVEWLEGKLTQA